MPFGRLAIDPVVFIYFVYGLAFFSLGLVTSLQARAMHVLPPIRRLWLLSTFGLLHGASEWVELALAQRWLEGDFAAQLDLGLKALSFAFLIQFGAEFVSDFRPDLRWFRLIGPGLALSWLVLVLRIDTTSQTWYAVASAAMRYALAAPGSALAAYALWAGGTTWHSLESSRSYFRGAAIAFAAYGIVAGLTVRAAPFFPASAFNQESFEATLGVPVVLLRTLCALAISGLLAEAFIVEVSRAQVRMIGLLQQMDQMREEFISVVAHDLRSPVAVIAGYAELLKGLPAQRHASSLEQRSLEGIQSSAKHLERMVDDLLDASRIDAHRLVLAKEWVDLPRLVADVTERSGIITAGHPVRVEVKGAIPGLLADPARLDQILTNLLSNAAKYSLAETPISVTLEANYGEVVVGVANEGPGIAPEERERIFTRFHRTRDAAASKVAGLGLGLYITKGLVEAHGGRIWLDSRETEIAGRKVTAFFFTLPVEGRAEKNESR